MPFINWTKTALTTANTNRDGSGTVVELYRVTNPAGEYCKEIRVETLGTNVSTIGVVLINDGNGLGDTENTAVLGEVELPAVTAGTWAATDTVTMTIKKWLPPKSVLYAQVHDNQASGRQFVAYFDASYQREEFGA